MANEIISASIQSRRDTTANWTDSTYKLKAGEIGIATDANPAVIKIGDGTRTWGQLPASFGNGVLRVVYEGVSCSNEDGVVTINNIPATVAKKARTLQSGSYSIYWDATDNNTLTVDSPTDIFFKTDGYQGTKVRFFADAVPEYTNTNDLGTNDKKWRGVYATNVYASGDVIAGHISDRRLKDDIQLISPAEANDVLQALQPVSFKWNSTEEELSNGHRKGIARSFIADEFLKVLPNAGQKIYDGQYDAIYIEQVIPYLVAGYQKQQREIEELRKELNELKAKLS